MGIPKDWTSIEPHVIMGCKKGEVHEKQMAREILQSLRKANEKEKIQCKIRGFNSIQEKEILRQEMYGISDASRNTNENGGSEKNTTIQEETMRKLQQFRGALCASQRRELAKQPTIKLGHALQFLSYFFASRTGRHKQKTTKEVLFCLREIISQAWLVQYSPNKIKTSWESLSEKEKDWTIMAVCFGRWWSEWPETNRTINDCKNRVDRLKALGNGIVPVVVREFLWRCNQ